MSRIEIKKWPAKHFFPQIEDGMGSHVVLRKSAVFCNVWSKQVFDKQQYTDNYVYVCCSSVNFQCARAVSDPKNK